MTSRHEQAECRYHWFQVARGRGQAVFLTLTDRLDSAMIARQLGPLTASDPVQPEPEGRTTSASDSSRSPLNLRKPSGV